MPLLNDAKKKISTINDLDTKEKYVRALRSSVIWEGVEDDRLPNSAASVAAASGLGEDGLEGNHVLLSKKDVVTYAADQGITKSVASIRKSLTATTYIAHFGDGRSEVRNGKKLLVTYAEARSILNIRTKGTMPSI